MGAIHATHLGQACIISRSRKVTLKRVEVQEAMLNRVLSSGFALWVSASFPFVIERVVPKSDKFASDGGNSPVLYKATMAKQNTSKKGTQYLGVTKLGVIIGYKFGLGLFGNYNSLP